MDKIAPCLWFKDNAEEAVKYYVSIFPDSKVDTIARWPMDRSQPAPAKKGDVLAIDFTLGGRAHKALNGESISRSPRRSRWCGSARTRPRWTNTGTG